jgi:hypothetical protein
MRGSLFMAMSSGLGVTAPDAGRGGSGAPRKAPEVRGGEGASSVDGSCLVSLGRLFALICSSLAISGGGVFRFFGGEGGGGGTSGSSGGGAGGSRSGCSIVAVRPEFRCGA